MYTLMNGGKGVLKFSTNKTFITEVVMINKELAPEMLKSGLSGALERWLAERSIDLKRPNARLLIKKLNLPCSPSEIVVKNRGLSLTDTYWVKHSPEESFKDFCLHRKESTKYIVETALAGINRKLPSTPNPELTNIGSFDKAWIKENDKWYLAKKGDAKSLYSELFACKLGKHLGFYMAGYMIRGNLLYSLNFTNERKALEHYASYRFKFEDIGIDEHTVYTNLSSTGLGEEYLNILFLDALVSNVDRHEFNFGVIKDSNNGKLLGLAPNFDNNLGFGAVGKPSTTQLKMYLNEFGLTEYQNAIKGKLNIKVVREIDKEVRKQVDPKNLKREQVFGYLEKIISILNG